MLSSQTQLVDTLGLASFWSAAKSDMQSDIASRGFLTFSDLSGYATTSYVSSAINDMLGVIANASY